MPIIAVETTQGTYHLPAGTPTYVSMPGGVRRLAVEELKEGQLALVHIQRGKAPQEIRKWVAQDPEYVRAREAVFVRSSEGAEVPLLRTLLARGFSRSHDPDLEARIMRERGNDLEPGERSYILDRIVEATPVARGVAATWLDGKVVLPIRTWDALHDLSLCAREPEATALREIHEGRGKEGSVHHRYTGVMWALRKLTAYLQHRYTGQGPGEEAGAADESRLYGQGRFASLISRVVRLISPSGVSDEYISVPVLSVREARGGADATYGPGPDPRLKRGLVTGDARVPALSKDDIFRTRSLLYEGMRDIVARWYDSGILAEHFGQAPAPDALRSHVLTIAFARLYSGKALSSVAPRGKKGKEMGRLLGNVMRGADRFFDDISRGEIDRLYGIPEGTFERTLSAFRQYGEALPRQVREAEEQVMMHNSKPGSMAQLAQALQAEGMAIPPTLLRHAPALSRYLTTEEIPKDVIAGIWNRGEDERFWQRAEVEGILGKLGIPEATRFYHPQNFVVAVKMGSSGKYIVL